MVFTTYNDTSLFATARNTDRLGSVLRIAVRVCPSEDEFVQVKSHLPNRYTKPTDRSDR